MILGEFSSQLTITIKHSFNKLTAVLHIDLLNWSKFLA
jgi:hypothetical protein